MSQRVLWVLAGLVALVLIGTAWMFRYAYLPPIKDGPTIGTVVVCKANRWTGGITCDSVTVDLESVVRTIFGDPVKK